MQIIARFSVDKWAQEEPWAPSGTGQSKNSAGRMGLVSSVKPSEGVRGHRCSLAVLICPPEAGVGCTLYLRMCRFPLPLRRPGGQGNAVSFFFSPVFFLIVGFGGGIWSALEYSPFSPVHWQSEMLPATFSPLISPNLILFLHGGGNFRCQEESSRSIYVISRRRCQSSSPSLLFSW